MIILKYTCPIYKRSTYSAIHYKGGKYAHLFTNVSEQNLDAMMQLCKKQTIKEIVIIQVKSKVELVIN